MKPKKSEWFLIIGFILAILFCSIPFKQVVEVTKGVEYTSMENHHIEVGFGGPSVTWVTVMCNRTAEIRFLYQTGVWTSMETVLLASYRSMAASFNFNSEHSTNIVEVVSNGPILVRIVYSYLIEAEFNLFSRVLYSLRYDTQSIP